MNAARAERAELEGFAAGLRWQLDRLRQEDRAFLDGEKLWSDADRELEKGHLAEARSQFLQLDRWLTEAQVPQELTDRPRGLVAYRARGSIGVPPPREEEPVANRLLLAQRLWVVRRSQGYSVESLLPQLREAERAYQSGDRPRTREIVNEVLSALEAMDQV